MSVSHRQDRRVAGGNSPSKPLAADGGGLRLPQPVCPGVDSCAGASPLSGCRHHTCMAPSLCAAVTQVPSAYISWPEAVRGSLPTQGGRDVPSCTVGSRQLGRQRCPTPLRSAEHGAHKTAKTERSGGQSHAAKSRLWSSPAWTSVTASSERAEMGPATSQLCRQGSTMGSPGRAGSNGRSPRGILRCPKALNRATGSDGLPDWGRGAEGAQSKAGPQAPQMSRPPGDHR